MTDGTVQGIDVSHYQGKVNWNEVAKAGKAFAFIKATDGIASDPMFAVNWPNAEAAGFRRGGYHFFRALSDPLRQANHFLRQVEDDPGELPPVLDFEMLGSASVDQALCAARIWMKAVEEATGRKPILYTGPAFWSACLNSAMFANHPLWISHYTLAAQPRIPPVWKTWDFWQYSEKGVVPGISGPVDLNCFNGTLMELDAFGARIQLKSVVG